MPPTLPSTCSHSPVCRPARTSMPRSRHGLHDRAGAADRAGRAVEGGEEAVAGGVDLAAAEAGELRAHAGVVLAPAAPASGGRRARRACSVEPTMSVNRTVASTRSGSTQVPLAALPDPPQERVDVVADLVGRTHQPWSHARQLHELGARDALRHVARPRRRPCLVAGRDGGRASARWIGGQDVADVDLAVHPPQRRRARRGSRSTAPSAATSAAPRRRPAMLGESALSVVVDPGSRPQSSEARRDHRAPFLGRRRPRVVRRPHEGGAWCRRGPAAAVRSG